MSTSLLKTVRLPREIYEHINDIAQGKALTFSTIVREALEAYTQAELEGQWNTCMTRDKNILSEDEIESLMIGVLDELPDDIPESGKSNTG